MSLRSLAASVAIPLLAGAIAILIAVKPLKNAVAASRDLPAGDLPAYDKSGNLLPPTDYRQWVYLTSGIDMSYTARSTDAGGHSKFDNVFVDPAAYRSFQQTGTWPDKTTMVLEVREAMSRGSINLSGHYQGTEIMGLEVHVKDETHFPGKWAFFDFDSPSEIGKLIPQSATCYTCHEAHGAVDTTFVQFYPTLLPIAQKKGTLSEAYLRENAGAVR